MNIFFKTVALIGITILINKYSIAQTSDGEDIDLLGQSNAIRTAVPLLTIAPDARAGAMGDVGAATTPDAHSMHWNPAKFAFIEEDMGFSFSYTPWLRALNVGIDLSYLTGHYRLDENQTLAASLIYFSLGDIAFTDLTGEKVQDFKPREYAIDFSYSRKFSPVISGGFAARYIYSNLTGGYSNSSIETYPGQTFAMDISSYYTNDKMHISDKDATLSFGINISNIGPKISYSEDEKDFIPTNLKIGSNLLMELDSYNKISFALDLNKLLVPTPPYTEDDSIVAGMSDDVPTSVGIFQSFYDAPGGFKEELHEISYSLGTEYWYADQFAIRAGYYGEHETKGDRKFITLGVGLKLNVFSFDFAYLVPLAAQSPLANTLKFSLTFDIIK